MRCCCCLICDVASSLHLFVADFTFVAAQNTKGMLTNPMDYSSDEFEILTDDEQASVGAASVCRSVRTTTSKSTSSGTRSRLPHNVEKQLLLDIEQNGGIVFIARKKGQGLSDLLHKVNRKIYGNRGDDIRRKIGQRVQKYKKLSPAAYLELLKKFGIESVVQAAVGRTAPIQQSPEPTTFSSPPKVINTRNSPVTPAISPLPTFKSPPKHSSTKKPFPSMAPTKYGTFLKFSYCVMM